MNTVVSPVNIDQRKNLDIKSGDTVRVHQKIEEKGKTRIQVFEGIVIARKHGKEAGGTFTVRRTSQGVGVEKIFPLYSPLIDKIEITKRSKVRRSKLYHIREKAAKEIRRQMRNVIMMDTVMKDEEEKPEAEPEESSPAGEEAETTKVSAEEKVDEEAKDTPEEKEKTAE